MRVALLAPDFLAGKGGAERVAAEVATLICRSNGTASILCNHRGSGEPSYPIDPGVAVKTFALATDQGVAGERGCYDVVLGFGMSGFFKRIPEIARLLDVPFAIQECTNPWRMVSTLYVRRQDGCRTLQDAFWLRQAVFSEAAAVRFTVPGYASSVLPVIQPFTYAFYNALAAPVGKPSQTRTRKVICVGAMKNTNKNGMAAVHAFVEFARQQPGWELHLYGRNIFVDELAAVQRENPGISIVDHGIESDISRIYSDAALLVIPSFEEGLPNVVVEAFSYGVPCVGFADCLGVSHLIRDGETGLLADREDPQGLSRALALACEPDLRQEMSKKALAFAQVHLAKPDFEANWLRLLHNAVAGLNRDGQPQRPPGIAQAEPFGRLLPKLLRRTDRG